MYNLILKEFLVQKKTLLYGIVYTIVCAYAFGDIVPNGGAIYTVAPFAVIYLFVNYSGGFDDKSKADIVFNSLPIKREDIVISKYLAIVCFGTFGILCSALLGLIGFYTGFPRVSRLISVNDIITVLVGGGIFAAVFYPLYFKYGMVKMKFANIILFLIFMFLPSYIVEYAEKNPNSAVVKQVISVVANASEWKINMLLAVVACIIVLISLLVSMRIYKNKDF